MSNVTFLLSVNDLYRTKSKLRVVTTSHSHWQLVCLDHLPNASNYYFWNSIFHARALHQYDTWWPDSRLPIVTLWIGLRWLTVLEVDRTLCSPVLDNSTWCTDGDSLSYSYALHEAPSPLEWTPVHIQRHSQHVSAGLSNLLNCDCSHGILLEPRPQHTRPRICTDGVSVHEC